MIFTEGKLPGVYLVELERKPDARGWFARSWCAREFAERGLESQIVQLNTQFSPRRGTLRGLHYQEAPHAEVKIVRCTRGAIFDVVVDLRPESPGYRHWTGRELTAEEGAMLYAPEGCAHGYLTLSDDCEVSYSTSAFYAPTHARGVRFDDPAFGIEWPAPVRVVSDQDRQWPDHPARGEPR